ncbi:hypothetical protein BCL32_4282 [Rhizobium mongolense USDA 1844]|uniref:Uncharacterized protein n=1 Tax=Rhizobium mongolense USDA 1844 TaxID=1079460 RepID=A0A559SNZ5_9HYPH|nr:hypothetical protein BCL32_4282 [Rhizobium mongolense USDA 1844]
MTAAGPALTVPKFEQLRSVKVGVHVSESFFSPVKVHVGFPLIDFRRVRDLPPGVRRLLIAPKPNDVNTLCSRGVAPRKPRQIKGRIAAAFFIYVTTTTYFLRGTFGTALAFFGASLTSAFAFLTAVFLAFAFVFSSPSSSSSASR